MSGFGPILCVLAAVLVAPAQPTSLERARRLAQSGRVADAIRLLEEQGSGDSAAELAFLSQLHATAGGIPQAVSTLERALELEPHQVRLRLTRGAMLFELRRFDEATGELQKVIQQDPGVGLAHYYLASVYKGMGDLDAAEREAERAVSLLPAVKAVSFDSDQPPPGVAARHVLAEVRFERGDGDDEVASLLREVIELEPAHAPARYLLSRVLLKQGRADEAKAELERFARIKRADEHLTIGRELARMAGRGQDSMAELMLAVEADPDHARALALLGEALVRAGRRDEARPYLERALALHPEASDWIRRFLP